MSLVAYNSSDDSQNSDDDAEKQPMRAQKETLTGRISDEDDVSAPTNNHNNDNVDQTDGSVSDSQSHNNLSAATLLKGLPAPARHQLPTVEDELEEAVQPKVSQISDAPKPPQKRVKQPARISIPAVQYSSDEDEPDTKKKKTSSSKSGLFSLLPEPVHAAKKESNRLLIPHTLSKKPPQKQVGVSTASQVTTELKNVPVAPATTVASSAAAASSVGTSVGTSVSSVTPSTGSHKYSTQFQALTGYYSDSDDEDMSTTNFFSLTSKPEESGSVSSESIPSVTSASIEKRVICTDTSSKDTFHKEETESKVVHEQSKTKDELNQAEDSSVTLTSVTSTSTNPDAPLDFKPSVNPNAPLSFKSSLSAPAAYGLAGPFRAKPGPAYYSMHETALSQEVPGVTTGSYDQEPPHLNEVNPEEVAQYMEDEQFLRLQGKRRRGKEEINIVEANMDDFVSSSNIELTKGLTEESQSMSHRRNKDNNPTHVQKRKHQITYLAFQAKERELELKNTWAENRMTKRQTQAKYGF